MPTCQSCETKTIVVRTVKAELERCREEKDACIMLREKDYANLVEANKRIIQLEQEVKEGL